MKRRMIMFSVFALIGTLVMGAGHTEGVLAEEEEISPEVAVEINETNFPDDNFRDYILRCLDSDNDCRLSEDEIKEVQKLRLSGMEITSLKGIEFFTWLEYLNCSDNQLTVLNVNDCVHLTDLICYDNQLTELNTTNNKELVTLRIGYCGWGNNISSIDITQNTKLEYLGCGYNPLTELDFTKNLAIRRLECDSLHLEELDVSFLTSLEHLSCDSNQLVNLNVSTNKDLKHLLCRDNKLKELDVSKNKQLIELNCSGNSIDKLDLSTNVELKHLVCDHNPLTTLDVGNNPSLEALYCRSTYLEHLDVSRNTNLKQLFCSWSGITALDVRSNPSLETLECSGNSLTSLDVSKNTNLKVLECGVNNLTFLDISKNLSLWYLDCWSNELTTLDVSKNLELERLKCHCNRILKLDITNNNKIVEQCLERGLTLSEDGTHYVCEDPNNTKYDPLIVDSFVELVPRLYEPIPKPSNTPTPTMTPIAIMPNVVGKSIDQAQENVINTLIPACDQVKINIQWEENDGSKDGNIVYEQDPREGYQFFVHCDYIYVTLIVYKEAPIIENPTIGDFAERLYTVALNRESDPSGKDYWTKEIENGNRTGGDCAHFFLIEAEEFRNRGLNEEDFVETLYQTFFGRASEPNGKAYWVGELKKGTKTREDVINGFIDSTEWCNICATYGVKSGAPNAKAEIASADAIGFATRLYTCCLGREPEDGGLKYWSLALTNLEQTGYGAAKFFFMGDEFVNFKTTNEEFVTRLYTTFMDREPESGGFNYWVGELKKGKSREDVMSSFAQCQEFANICAKYGIDRGEI